MPWTVANHDAFDPEYDALPEAVQDELLAMMTLLVAHGPQLGRPHADTLSGSRHANMKELRFKADDGVWRVAFAFDPERKAILLVAGDKSGVKQPSVHKIERQTDLYLSTLRRFVEAAGGTLELRVELPGKGVLHLTGVGDIHA